MDYTELTATDPGLLRKHSSFTTYTTAFATYDSIRTFYRPHPQADKLPQEPPLPLLVFIHGLGGSLAQFHSLLTSLVNVAPCLGFDLPGCGLSVKSSNLSREAYSTEALSELVKNIIEQHCDHANGQGVVLIGHSMGCSLSVMLASTNSPIHPTVQFETVGLVAICPKASQPTRKQILKYRKLLSIPAPVFDLWRRWDRRGGLESESVARFVGAGADTETKKLQLRFNENSRTSVWQKMAWGALPSFTKEGNIEGGLPGPEVWSGLFLPVYLVAGEADHVTTPEEVNLISEALGKAVKSTKNSSGISANIIPQVATPDIVDFNVAASARPGGSTINHNERYGLRSSNTETTVIEREKVPALDLNCVAEKPSQPRKKSTLKTTILPSPASHALLYDHATYRTLAGLIQTFLADHIDSRLSLGWQLQHLSTEGKWDVKNLVKWQAVRPVSEPIAGIFRAMKTLREIDESHSPTIFVKVWKDKIKAVIDISHESPVYNPRGLEEGGIEYHKFPTVSKIPPTSEEVTDFVALVNQLRSGTDDRLLGVHCHYGFNRTGFFICSYLIAQEGYSVQRAIDAFHEGRPPGIRHQHFIDTLFVRYCVGLKRAPTL